MTSSNDGLAERDGALPDFEVPKRPKVDDRPWDDEGRLIGQIDGDDKGSSRGGSMGGSPPQSLDEEVSQITSSRFQCISMPTEKWNILKTPEEGAEVIGTLEHGDNVDVVTPDPTSNYLELKTGGYVLRENKASGLIPSNLCPYVGTWDYHFNSRTNRYSIVQTDAELYYKEQTLKIRLHHADDPNFPTPPHNTWLTSPSYGGSANGTTQQKSIWFEYVDGKLRSLYQGSPSNQVTVCAERVALHDSRPISPIQGDMRESKPGQCGLWNLGNTCFMNSALQCTSSCEELVEYFKSGAYKKHLNRNNPLGAKGRLAEEYAALMQAMWSGEYMSLSPSKLKSVIDEFAPRFSGYQQHDSHELLSFLLDGLHEDVNLVRDKPYLPEDDVSKMSEVEKAELAWQRHRERNKSTVADLFEGQLRSVIKCNMCSHQESKFDPMTSISLPCQLESSRSTVVTVLLAPEDVTKPITKYMLIMKNTDDIKAVKNEIANIRSIDADHLIFNQSNESKLVTEYTHEPIYLYEGCCTNGTSLMRLIDPGSRKCWHIYAVPKDITLGECYSLTSKTVRMVSGAQEGADDVPEEFPVMHGNTELTATKEGKEPVRLEKFSVVVKDQRGEEEWEGNEAARRWKETVGSESYKTIDQCLEKYTEEEQLDEANTWYCPKCKDHVRAYKMISVWRPPKFLVIHLNRFSFTNSLWGRYGDGIRKKVDTDVRYTDCIDLSPSICKDSPAHGDRPIYDLYAVSCHMGSAMGGHYTAYTKAGGSWHQYNDRYVSPATLRDACTSNAYLLFYSRRDTDAVPPRPEAPPAPLSNGLSESPTDDLEASPKKNGQCEQDEQWE
eukprot:TRINITY_DN227_c2_g1_i2.p1 TRINITY_DN227_c2_g1~~TRINITY_DN227_c2_g1_i2.p1  ORF type:complete len:847 (+),score=241.01 TRINITY_DN227_c2_g1_i2:32-2542(+)